MVIGCWLSCQAFKFVTVARSKRFAPASPKDYRIRGLRSFPNLDAQQLIRSLWLLIDR
jgi:hypothetical protein